MPPRRGGGKSAAPTTTTTKKSGGGGGKKPEFHEFPRTQQEDEDIDDDIAFNSDDEDEFGAFFEAIESRQRAEKKQAKGADAASKGKKASGKKQGDDDDDEFGLGDDLGDDDDDDDSDYSSIGSLLDDVSADSDLDALGENDDDLLADDKNDDDDDDAAPQSKKQKKQKNTNKKTARDADFALAESLFPAAAALGDGGSKKNKKRGSTSVADDLLAALSGPTAAAAAAASSSSSDPQLQQQQLDIAAATKQRLQRVTKADTSGRGDGVLLPEASPDKVEKLERRQTRNLVKSDLTKWKAFLKQQRKQRGLKFPLKAPDQDPTAATLGGFANAVQHRQLDDLNRKAVLMGEDGEDDEGNDDDDEVDPDNATTGVLAKLAEKRQKKQFQEQQRVKKTVRGGGGDASSSSSATAAAIDVSQDLALKANALLGASGYGTTQAQREVGKSSRGDQQETRDGYVQFSEDGESGGKFSSAEFQATREHVAKLKSVLGYEIARRRRLNRIKSKAYRRVIRLEKEKQMQKRMAADALLNPERAQQRLARRLDKQRAEERVLQRHKNTSKWIQHAKRHALHDEGAKEAIQEQHRKHAVLMQKMHEPATADLDDAGDEGNPNRNDDSDDDERVVDALLAGKGRSVLWGNEDDDEDNDGQKKSKKKSSGSGGRSDATAVARDKLTEMKFMQRARDKNQRENDAIAEKLMGDVERIRGGQPRDAAASSGAAADDGTNSRRKFAPPSDKNPIASTINPLFPNLQQNISSNSVKKEYAGTRRQRDNTTTTTTTSGGGDGAEDHAAAAPVMSKAEAAATRIDRQDYLIARAFAQDAMDGDAAAAVSGPGDAVDAEFLRKKGMQVDGIMKPEDKNASLPGWGEWGGQDAQLNAKHKERVSSNEMKRRMERTTLMSARADASLDNVIINHDVDLVPSHQMLHMVPRPFSDATEFHRSMRQPVGPEWTTAQSFKRQVQPKVTTRAGVAIDPLDESTGLRKKPKTARNKVDTKSVSRLRLGGAGGGGGGAKKKKVEKAE